MDIIFKDLKKLWGKAVNEEKIDLDSPIGFISTDTRTLEKGNFFVPLVGNNFDGHNFLGMAVDIGVQAAIVSETFNGSIPTGLPHWVVSDTLYALSLIHI